MKTNSRARFDEQTEYLEDTMLLDHIYDKNRAGASLPLLGAPPSYKSVNAFLRTSQRNHLGKATAPKDISHPKAHEKDTENVLRQISKNGMRFWQNPLLIRISQKRSNRFLS